MKIFLDSADVSEIETHIASGFVDGVTTNPSLIAKAGRNILETITEICGIVDGLSAPRLRRPISKQCLPKERSSPGWPRTYRQGAADRGGLRTCRVLSDAGTQVNVTLCFTASQALLAAKAGATFISPSLDALMTSDRTAWG